MNFSNEEKRDMLVCYIEGNRNRNRAAQLYFERYFDRRQPSLPTFKNLYENLGEYGSFVKPNNVNNNIKEHNEVNVLACAHRNPSTSTRNRFRNGYLTENSRKGA